MKKKTLLILSLLLFLTSGFTQATPYAPCTAQGPNNRVLVSVERIKPVFIYDDMDSPRRIFTYHVINPCGDVIGVETEQR